MLLVLKFSVVKKIKLKREAVRDPLSTRRSPQYCVKSGEVYVGRCNQTLQKFRGSLATRRESVGLQGLSEKEHHRTGRKDANERANAPIAPVTFP